MPTRPHAEPPRLARSVLLQLLALAAGGLAAELPWTRSKAPPPPPPQKQEQRIRVVRLEKPPPLPKPPPSQPPKPPPPQPPPPQVAPQPRPPLAKTTPPPRPQPPSPPPIASNDPPPAPDRPPPKERAAPSKPPPAQKRAAASRPLIAADATAVHGVRLRVLIPRSAGDLEAHLKASGGCLVVSRLIGGGAEVVSVLGIDGERAVERPGPPCPGVPRLVRDAALDDALGSPLASARARNPGEELVLQVLLTDRLHDSARSALRARFGDVSEEEMGRRAAESGYELTCFAEPSGPVRCE